MWALAPGHGTTEMLQKSAFASVFWHAACFSTRLPLVNFDVHDSGLQDAQKELTTAADETPKKKLRLRKKGGRTPVHKGSPGVRRKLEFETPKGRSSKASRASKARSQEGHIGSEEGNASGSEDDDVFQGPFKRREGSSKPLPQKKTSPEMEDEPEDPASEDNMQETSEGEEKVEDQIEQEQKIEKKETADNFWERMAALPTELTDAIPTCLKCLDKIESVTMCLCCGMSVSSCKRASFDSCSQD